MKQLEELEKKYEELGAEIEKLKAEQDEEWPKVGDSYWYYSPPYISVQKREMCAKDCLDGCAVLGNLFRTKEAAESYRAWLTDPRTQARRMVEMCEGFYLNGIAGLMCTASNGNNVRIDFFNQTMTTGSLRFESEIDAKAAIDKLGEDIIKVALGVITGDDARDIVMRAMRKA